MSDKIINENREVSFKNENGEIVHELFEGINDIPAIPLEEYLKLGISTGWHYNSLEEELEDFISEKDRRIMEGRATKEDYKIDINIGDIVLVYEYVSSETGNREVKSYRIFVVQNIKKEYGKPNKYEGYELQTFGNQPKRKANIFNQDKDQYANNIWIGDFFSILDKGPKTIENECYIDVEHKYCFNDLELKEDGYWKGAISFEFSKFIKQCIKNAQNGDIEANKKMQWPMY